MKRNPEIRKTRFFILKKKETKKVKVKTDINYADKLSVSDLNMIIKLK